MSGIVNVVEAKGFFLEKDINEKVKRLSKGEINFQYYLSGQSGFPICHAINIVLTEFDLS